MSRILIVSPVPGRVAYTAPVGGRLITEPTTVRRSQWIESLLSSGDVEEVKEPEPAPAASATATAEAPRAAGKKAFKEASQNG